MDRSLTGKSCFAGWLFPLKPRQASTEVGENRDLGMEWVARRY